MDLLPCPFCGAEPIESWSTEYGNTIHCGNGGCPIVFIPFPNLTFFFGWTFGPALIGFFIIGVGFSGQMLLNQVVIADIVDFDES